MESAWVGKTQQVGHFAQRKMLISDVAHGQRTSHFVQHIGKARALLVEPTLQAALAQVQALGHCLQRCLPMGHAFGQLSSHQRSDVLWWPMAGGKQLLGMRGDDARKARIGRRHRAVQQRALQHQTRHRTVEPGRHAKDGVVAIDRVQRGVHEVDAQRLHRLAAELGCHHDQRGQRELRSLCTGLQACHVESVLNPGGFTHRDDLESRQIVQKAVVARQPLQSGAQVRRRAHGVIQYVELSGADQTGSKQAKRWFVGQVRGTRPQELLHGKRHARLGIVQPLGVKARAGHQESGLHAQEVGTMNDQRTHSGRDFGVRGARCHRRCACI